MEEYSYKPQNIFSWFTNNKKIIINVYILGLLIIVFSILTIVNKSSYDKLKDTCRKTDTSNNVVNGLTWLQGIMFFSYYIFILMNSYYIFNKDFASYLRTVKRPLFYILITLGLIFVILAVVNYMKLKKVDQSIDDIKNKKSEQIQFEQSLQDQKNNLQKLLQDQTLQSNKITDLQNRINKLNTDLKQQNLQQNEIKNIIEQITKLEQDLKNEKDNLIQDKIKPLQDQISKLEQELKQRKETLESDKFKYLYDKCKDNNPSTNLKNTSLGLLSLSIIIFVIIIWFSIHNKFYEVDIEDEIKNVELDVKIPLLQNQEIERLDRVGVIDNTSCVSYTNSPEQCESKINEEKLLRCYYDDKNNTCVNLPTDLDEDKFKDTSRKLNYLLKYIPYQSRKQLKETLDKVFEGDKSSSIEYVRNLIQERLLKIKCKTLIRVYINVYQENLNNVIREDDIKKELDRINKDVNSKNISPKDKLLLIGKQSIGYLKLQLNLLNELKQINPNDISIFKYIREMKDLDYENKIKKIKDIVDIQKKNDLYNPLDISSFSPYDAPYGSVFKTGIIEPYSIDRSKVKNLPSYSLSSGLLPTKTDYTKTGVGIPELDDIISEIHKKLGTKPSIDLSIPTPITSLKPSYVEIKEEPIIVDEGIQNFNGHDVILYGSYNYKMVNGEVVSITYDKELSGMIDNKEGTVYIYKLNDRYKYFDVNGYELELKGENNYIKKFPERIKYKFIDLNEYYTMEKVGVSECEKTELGERVAKYMTEDIYIYMTILRKRIYTSSDNKYFVTKQPGPYETVRLKVGDSDENQSFRLSSKKIIGYKYNGEREPVYEYINTELYPTSRYPTLPKILLDYKQRVIKEEGGKFKLENESQEIDMVCYSKNMKQEDIKRIEQEQQSKREDSRLPFEFYTFNIEGKKKIGFLNIEDPNKIKDFNSNTKNIFCKGKVDGGYIYEYTVFTPNVDYIFDDINNLENKDKKEIDKIIDKKLKDEISNTIIYLMVGKNKTREYSEIEFAKLKMKDNFIQECSDINNFIPIINGIAKKSYNSYLNNIDKFRSYMDYINKLKEMKKEVPQFIKIKDKNKDDLEENLELINDGIPNFINNNLYFIYKNNNNKIYYYNPSSTNELDYKNLLTKIKLDGDYRDFIIYYDKNFNYDLISKWKFYDTRNNNQTKIIYKQIKKEVSEAKEYESKDIEDYARKAIEHFKNNYYNDIVKHTGTGTTIGGSQMKLQIRNRNEVLIPIPLYFLLCQDIDSEQDCEKYSKLNKISNDINDYYYYEYRNNDGDGDDIGYTNKNLQGRLTNLKNSITSYPGIDDYEKYELQVIIDEIRSIPYIKIPNENIVKQLNIMNEYYKKYNELSKQIIGNFSYNINNNNIPLNNIPVSAFIENYYKNVMENQKQKKQQNPNRINIKKPAIISEDIINKLKDKDDYKEEYDEIIQEYNDKTEDERMNFSFRNATQFMKKYTTIADKPGNQKSKSKKK